jgi:protein-tyrosine kinase
MSNIYEALEQACREKTAAGTPAGTSTTTELALRSETTKGISLKSEMSWLHHQVGSLISGPHQLIQFMGSRRGEGVSTIIREFAQVAVERHGKSVLILDSAYQDPARTVNINVTCEYGWLDLMEKGELIDKAIYRIGDSNLYFAPIAIQASFAAAVKDLSSTVTLWEKLRERFDLILIDSSSDDSISESIALSRNVDGVVLVIEAEKTRRKVAESVKSRIMANGGTILGVVLNKRRHYIPDFLYKKL